jgi:serine protease inhibitor
LNLCDLLARLTTYDLCSFICIFCFAKLSLVKCAETVWLLQVDEKGAEAAAATAVVIGLMCAMSPPPKELRFIADHPFLIALVRDGRHVLFLGRYAVPA